ncbi:hypothetical protein TMatcc_000997 [Talaromyces marneffei ATCC 18224]
MALKISICFSPIRSVADTHLEIAWVYSLLHPVENLVDISALSFPDARNVFLGLSALDGLRVLGWLTSSMATSTCSRSNPRGRG